MHQRYDADVWHVTSPGIMDTDRYLSAANAPDLEEDVRLCIQSGARDMVINCAALTYLTGAGMRALLNVARMMERAGGKITVKGLEGQPLEIYEACGFETVIPQADNVTDMSKHSAAYLHSMQ